MEDHNIRIGVFGAYGHPNFGDQLLFNILHGWLKEFNEQIRVIVPWGDKEHIDWPGDDVVVGGGWKDMFSCDAIVFGGGGYLGEPGKPSEGELPEPSEYSRLDRIGTALHLPRCLGGCYFGEGRYLRTNTVRFLKCASIARSATLNRIPFCIIGTGLGPVTTKLGRCAIASVLKRAKKIILRDEESANYAKDLCYSSKIVSAADMVLSECITIEKRNLREMKKVGVHLGPNVEKNVGIGSLAEGVKKIMDDGAEVTFIADCAPISQNILAVPEKIVARIGRIVEIVPYTGVRALLGVLNSLDIVLTTKLHVGLTAYAKGVFPVSMAAHKKTMRFYKQAGLEEFCSDLSDNGIKQAIEKIRQIRKKPGLATELLVQKREFLSKLVLDNKTVLNDFLKEYIGVGKLAIK